MDNIAYNLKTVSPVFCSGANKSVEIRPASFKGIMRYWYRALVAENDLKKLHKRENELFGSTSNSSSFRIRLLNNINKRRDVEKKCLLPHKNKPFSNAIKQNVPFKLELSAKFRLEEIKDVFELALLLGGIGKRSRRGFGSIANTEWKFEDTNDLMNRILKILNEHSGKKYIMDDRIISVKKNGIFAKTSLFDYPTIEKIRIGSAFNSCDDLLRKIGKDTHIHCNKALGSGNPRMASPAYVTINEINGKYYPVVTKLTPCYPKNYLNSSSCHDYDSIIDSFIESVVK